MHIIVLTYRLYKYGQSFMHNIFESDLVDVDQVSQRPEMELWDRTTIWASFPEMSYKEMMESDSGLKQWLDLFYRVNIINLFSSVHGMLKFCEFEGSRCKCGTFYWLFLFHLLLLQMQTHLVSNTQEDFSCEEVIKV